ncbi:MAG: hypothetical protein HRT66_06495, partial [Flavobacteriaceae bacterium]|nr:hypothetical protein [Flavobacteriaceae bacterium]
GKSKKTEQGTKVRLVDGEWKVDEYGTHYGIWTIEDLQAMDYPKYWLPHLYYPDIDKSDGNWWVWKFTLMKDLDFTKDSSYREPNNKPSYILGGTGFISLNIEIGLEFEGNNKTIKNLYMKEYKSVTPHFYAGLFKRVYYCKI